MQDTVMNDTGFTYSLLFMIEHSLQATPFFCLHGNHSFPVSIAVYSTSILLLSRGEEWMNLCMLANRFTGGTHHILTIF